MDSSLVVTVLSSSLSENFNFDSLKFLELAVCFICLRLFPRSPSQHN